MEPPAEPRPKTFLESIAFEEQQREKRRKRLLEVEFAPQPRIDREFEDIAEGFTVADLRPRRWPWPIRVVVAMFKTLNGIRRML